jgi:hypothetical protein
LKNKNFTYFIPFVVIFAVLALLIGLFFTFFKIEHYTKYIDSSDEAKKNKYLAMDKWLKNTGHPVLIHEKGSIKEITEADNKNIIIFASSITDFTTAEFDKLYNIVIDGCNLILFLDGPQNNLTDDFISRFDIECKFFKDFSDDEDEDKNDNNDNKDNKDTEKKKNNKIITVEGADKTVPAKNIYAQSNFDKQTYFRLLNEVEYLYDDEYSELKDNDGHTRLVKVNLKSSVFIVSGIPYFMKSLLLKKNNSLAWSISGALDNGGFTIIRSKEAAAGETTHDYYAEGFWDLFTQNPAYKTIFFAVIAVIIVGFWITLPSFGKVLEERTLPGKPIKMRFLSEIRFLKRYGALRLYLKPYTDEIIFRYAQDGIEGDYLIETIANEYNIDKEIVSDILKTSGKISIATLLEYNKICKKITTIKSA